MTVATLTAGVQSINLVILAGIVVACLVLMRRWRDTRLLLWPPLMWGGFGVVYYGLILAGLMTGQPLLLWGAIHRMLGGLMVLGGITVLWAIGRRAEDSEDDDGAE